MKLPADLADHSGTNESARGRKRVMVCVPRYLPGYKSGGPVRAISNMIANLSPLFEFFVVTRDRDATDALPFPGITPGRWHSVGEAQVLYCTSITSAVLRRAFHEVRPDIIHLNSFQDKPTRLMVRLRRLGAFRGIPMLLAPRGEFSPGAMRIKPVKKFIYRNVSRLLGLYDGLHWQVSAPPEGRDLLRAAPAHRLSPDCVHVSHEIFDGEVSAAPHPPKEAGEVKFAFISRISEMKNLHFLLDVLGDVAGNVTLNLFGPIADKDTPYWELCQAAMRKLPDNIRAQYFGSLDHSAVPQTLRDHHFFVLPTKGENYCHAAVESIINGTPVILSDATPWVKLAEVHAGFDIPLTSRQEWIDALQQCVDMSQQMYSAFLEGTQEYGKRFSIEEAKQEHIAMFQAALGQVA